MQSPYAGRMQGVHKQGTKCQDEEKRKKNDDIFVL